MEKINYTKEQFEELLSHPLIGNDGKQRKGGFASIYEDPTKKYAVKVFDLEKVAELMEERGPSLEEIVDGVLSISEEIVLKENNVVGLIHPFYVEDKLVGYFAELIRGGTLLEIKEGQFIPEVSLDEFKEKCELLYQNVINISKEKWIMGDLSNENIVYDSKNNTFKFIDYDIWTKENNDSIENILDYNLSNLEEEFGEFKPIEKHFHK